MNLRRLQYFVEFARHADLNSVLVDWDSIRHHIQVLEKELGPVTNRIGTFIVQQSEETGNLDDVLIAFSRLSESEFNALLDRLRAIPGVHRVEVKSRPDRRTSA